MQKSTEINGHSGLDNSDWCIRFKTMGVNVIAIITIKLYFFSLQNIDDMIK